MNEKKENSDRFHGNVKIHHVDLSGIESDKASNRLNEFKECGYKFNNKFFENLNLSDFEKKIATMIPYDIRQIAVEKQVKPTDGLMNSDYTTLSGIENIKKCSELFRNITKNISSLCPKLFIVFKNDTIFVNGVKTKFTYKEIQDLYNKVEREQEKMTCSDFIEYTVLKPFKKFTSKSAKTIVAKMIANRLKRVFPPFRNEN